MPVAGWKPKLLGSGQDKPVLMLVASCVTFEAFGTPGAEGGNSTLIMVTGELPLEFDAMTWRVNGVFVAMADGAEKTSALFGVMTPPTSVKLLLVKRSSEEKAPATLTLYEISASGTKPVNAGACHELIISSVVGEDKMPEENKRLVTADGGATMLTATDPDWPLELLAAMEKSRGRPVAMAAGEEKLSDP